jgi:two-component system phosphate regulon sensor histidine kinase PhoR
LTATILSKLLIGITCILLVTLGAVDLLVTRIIESNYLETRANELLAKCRVLALAAPEQRPNLARAVGSRLTVVDASGRVLTETDAPVESMENHRERPEMREALAGGEGVSRRISPTTGVEYLYVAIPHQGGALRLAVPLAELKARVASIRRRILSATALAFLPAMLVAGIFARVVSSRLGKIIDYSRRLAAGEFEARLDARGRGELSILSSRLNETASKLQKMFQTLEREHAELEKLERIRKDFVINVSHELRTPLASIQGYTETLLDGALQDPEHNVRFLTIIRQNAERLGRLIADLMTISRLELKTQKFQFASYRVNALLAEAVDSMMPVAAKKEISISLDRTDEDIEVFCDSEAVQQVLINLLDNAVKYTPEGGAITVGARQTHPDFVEIFVRDTGIGIPAEDLPRLFERFYRVDKARSRELGGTGLGLAIVKHLVRAQGGTVRVESRLNEGSVFTFTLPVHDLGLSEQADVRGELTVG